MSDILRTGRAELLANVEALRAENTALKRDHGIMLETLTHAQAKGSALQDEVRALRRVLSGKLIARGFEHLTDTCEQLNILVDLLIVRWRGDAKYGTAEAHADLPLGFGNPIEHEARVSDRAELEALHALKKARGNHTCWAFVIEEEHLELRTSESEERAEAEALDLANVCLKFVEARRIRRERVKGAT